MSGGSVLGYTGFFLDRVTGAYSLGNGYRMYLPGLMRFSAPDASSPFDEGGVNSYGYCADDPINYSDPTGHAPWGEELSAAIAGRGLAELSRDQVADVLDPAGASQHSAAVRTSNGDDAAPGPSGASLPAVHAAAAGASPDSPKDALAKWLDTEIAARGEFPLPVELTEKQLEGTEPLDREQLFNDAYVNGQIKLYPEVFDLQEGVLVEWEPLIKVNNSIVDRNNPRIVRLMMDFHATKGQGSKAASNNKYWIRKGTSKLLPKGLTLARALEAAIGSRHTPGGFTPILMDGYDQSRAAHQYTRFLAQRVKYLDG